MSRGSWPASPVGDGTALAKAAKLLGPYHFASEAEAQVGLSSFGRSRPPPICSEVRAIRAVEDLVRQLLNDLRAEKAAPRPKLVAQKLKQIGDLARELDRAITRADDLTLDILAGAFGLAGIFPDSELDKAQRWLRDPWRFLLIRGDEPNCLQLLVAAAERAAGNIVQRHGESSSGIADRGGRGTIATHLFGPAKRRFVLACCKTFEASGHREKIISTEGGALYEFATSVWSYATGEDPESTGLSSPIMVIAPVYRRLLPKADEAEELEGAAECLRQGGSNGEADEMRLQAVRLRAEVGGLLAGLIPASRRRRTT